MSICEEKVSEVSIVSTFYQSKYYNCQALLFSAKKVTNKTGNKSFIIENLNIANNRILTTQLSTVNKKQQCYTYCLNKSSNLIKAEDETLHKDNITHENKIYK